MIYHKLLIKQINKYLPEDLKENESIKNFVSAVSDSYNSFERDSDLLNHAFKLSELEYQTLYENLTKEYALKSLSIEKLKKAVKNIDKENNSNFDFDNDDLLVIVDYLNSEIAKRKETEDNLSRTVKLLTTLLSNLNSGILVEDEHRKILYTNQLFCDMFSVPIAPDDMTGIDCSNSAEESKALFNNPDGFVSRIANILSQKKLVLNDELKLTDGRILSRDYIPIYINDEYKGHLWDYTDITERKNFENKLIDITNIQEGILNGTDYAIIYTDTQGLIKTFNKGAEKMLGYSAAEIIDIHTPQIFHHLDEVVKKAKELSLELGMPVAPGFEVFIKKAGNNVTDTNEWTYITKDGVNLTVLLSVSSIKNSKNETIGFLGIARNISEQKQAQKALEISEERYRNIVEKSSEIIYKTNELGYFTYLNPAAEKLSGYSSSELLSRHFSDIIRVDYRKRAILQYSNQINSHVQSSYFEFPVKSKSGEEKWLGQSVQLITNGDKVEMLTLAIDITKQKINEFALLETNKRLELLNNLINNTSDAIQVSLENGQLVYINNEAMVRLGIQKNDIENHFVKDFELNFNTPGKWEKHVKDIKNAEILIYEGENTNIITGISFPVEVTVKYISIDKVGYIIANSRDISERKAVEESLRKQREKYQNIIANINLGLLEVDLDENIQYMNHAFEVISGYSQQELLGKKSTSLFVADGQIDQLNAKLARRKQGLSDMYEILVLNKANQQRWWMISAAPNYNDKGELVGSIGIHLDITASKELERELELARQKAEESSKAKEAFLANMSHEIRTPLNGIIGMIRELNKEALSEKQRYYINNTSIASQHLLSVLNNILDISKIEAGELQIENHDFDFDKILNDVKSIMLAKCVEKKLFFNINRPENTDMYFVGDSSRFRQVFLNLVGNAVKFTEKGGITIDCKLSNIDEEHQAIDVVVSDTGIGMDDAFLKSIFQKFSQEDPSISRKYGGSGLGMAITRELILLMNGTIDVESKKNEGTRFIMNFILPVGKVENINKENANVDLSLTKNINVLLVEDNEFNRIVANNTLRNFKCDVTEAENGQEAINLLKAGKTFDVILMDLQMPIMDGFESTKIIRNELNDHTPIIALTANAFKSELEQCKQIGMNECVTKPFEESKLMSAIYKLVNLESTFVRHEVTSADASSNYLYDLEKLNKLFNGDRIQVKRMVDIFIKQCEESSYLIKEANQAQNMEVLYQQVHKIKPSVDSMGIASLKDTTRWIEKIAREGNYSKELKQNIEFLLSTLEKVVKELKTLK